MNTKSYERHDWTEKLPEDVDMRLAECRTRKDDIPILVNTRYLYYKENKPKNWIGEYTKEDALISIMDLLDSNSQSYLTDLTKDEYNELIR